MVELPPFSAVAAVVMVLLFLALLMSTDLAQSSLQLLGKGEYLAESGIHFFANVGFGVSDNAGKLVNASSDTVANVAKTGIDITNGAVHNAGYLMQGKSLDMAIHQANYPVSEPDPALPNDPADPVTLTWCLVEKKEHGDNNCTRMNEGAKCNSGHVFTSASKCHHAD